MTATAIQITSTGDAIRHIGSVFENKGRFQAGDKVLYTNYNGKKTEREVRGIRFVKMKPGVIEEQVWVSGVRSLVGVEHLELINRAEMAEANE